MTRAALVKLLIAQTMLLVLALWASAWLGRDEFLLATEAPQEEEIETTASPVAEKVEGVPTVRLTRKAQRVVGIEVATAEEIELAETRRLPATVLDVQPLAELRGRVQAAHHEVEAARATAVASAAEQKRVHGLYNDERNASQRELEAATARATADAARERAAQATLTALRDEARARWGARIAAWLDAPAGSPLDRLMAGHDTLLRVGLPSQVALPADAVLTLPREAGAPLRTTPLGAAPASDSAGPGRLYLVAGAGLVPGQRVELAHSDALKEAGALVPPTAIVWHAGQAWVYVRKSGHDADEAPSKAPPSAASDPAGEDDDTPDADAFERRATPRARRHGERWFLPAFFEVDPVVVQGAQVLLSEELKYQIRDENDD